MLFNKTNTGQTELKELLGFLYASNNFANIKTDIALAEEDMIELIGQAVYDRAKTYYDNPDPVNELNANLVKHIQLPVAYYAAHAYTAHTDVSHGGDGRKIIVAKEGEKLAWEWMLNRDDEAILNKAHKTTDRLIAFLEKNEDKIEEWKGSDVQKAARRLFIPTTKIFESVFPIDNSRRFFIKIIPFMEEIERKHIRPILGVERYEDIKAALKAGSYEDTDGFLSLIRVPVAYLTLSTAIRRLSITLLPNGIFQDYESERMTQKAKQPASINVRREVLKALEADGMFELENLQKEIAKLDTEAIGETYEPKELTGHMDTETKVMRV
jgi:hypothetical protein